MVATSESVLDFVDLCHNCGHCCYLVIDGKLSDIPCPHLVIKEDGTSMCDTYNRRLGRFISTQGHTFMCVPRVVAKFNYKHCGYNKPGKPML